MRGIRTRLALALVALVTLTVIAIGLGTYAFVEARLRDSLLGGAQRQAQFNLSVLVPERLPDGVTRETYATSGLPEAFRLRGDVETLVDYRDGGPNDSSSPLNLPPTAIGELSQAVRDSAAAGRLGFAWQPLAGRPSLVLGGRSPAGGPDFYFVFPAVTVDEALEQLRFGLLAAAVVAILLALATAGIVARGILRPVSSGSAAAARIAAGDLSARVAAGGADEFARFAGEFNRMADSLADSIGRLEVSERRNRQFAADVAHELRTPLTALLGEAAIIEADLDRLQPDARRAAQLLVEDVRRLRDLVEDLMEVSRFDAHAEQATLEPLDLRAAVRSIVGARLPTAALALPETPIAVEADVLRLDRILGNLLDNAREHAPGAPVEVSVGTVGSDGTAGTAFVRVADRGPGVATPALPRLFDRFFKADASRAAGSSGLGLAIAAEHAALLGGTLVAENRDGGGLAVTLRLPVTGSLPASDPRDTLGVEPDPVIDSGPARETGGAPDPAPRPNG
jgi:two-component system, OmpR family, sensor histidine kinase MtrB